MSDLDGESAIPDNRGECRHATVTLCQWQCDDGWFCAYQCDNCGWVTNQLPTAADIEDGHNLPQLDMLMWEAAIERWLRRMLYKNAPLHNAVGFFMQAAHRGR